MFSLSLTELESLEGGVQQILDFMQGIRDCRIRADQGAFETAGAEWAKLGAEAHELVVGQKHEEGGLPGR